VSDTPSAESRRVTPDDTTRGSRNDVSRRAVLFGAGVAIGVVGTAAVVAAVPHLRPGDAEAEAAVPATGTHQAGVARPAVPQSACLVSVGDLDVRGLRASLERLSTIIPELTASATDLTVTVGVGAGALATTRHPELAEAATLPVFAGDADLPASRRGGDVLLSVNADDPALLEPTMAALTAAVDGWQPRWSDQGFRGAPDGDVSRNPFGYHDGIIIPRTEDELERDVWIDAGPLAGGTICVIRRFALDVAGFRALGQESRDRIVGREQWTGAPLSGGARDDEVDLVAKTATGELIIPARAHARAAHPSFTGSGLMLRRSYSYRASDEDSGHLFISFQNDVQTFARTQLRLDETDDLMAFSRPTATAAFAILPGFTTARPLGHTLF